MFDAHRDYPTAVTPNGATNPQAAQRLALAWVVEQQQAIGGQILVYVPRKGDLERMDNALAEFSKHPRVAVGTHRDRASAWSGGPAIAAWPTRDDLAQLMDDHRTRALVVIPWNDSDVAAWIAAAQPEPLGEAVLPADAARVIDPVVVAGLRQLSRMVNHANNLAGALDHRDAVAVLKLLHSSGYALDADAIYAWALANGWPGRGAERLRELVGKFVAGVNVRLQGGSPLRADALDRWRTEADGAR